MNFSTFITEQHLSDSIRTDNTFNFDNFKTDLQNAAEQYLFPILSEEFVEKVVDGTNTEPKIVEYVRQALINFGAAIYFDGGSLNIGSQGIQEIMTDKQKPVRLEVLSNAQNSRIKTGYAKVDNLLIFLYKNKDEEYAALWKDSDAFADFEEFPLKTPKEFGKYCRIHNSLSMFLSLRPAMYQAMNNEINPLIKQFNALTTDNEQKAYFDAEIKNALANLSYAYGVMDLTSAFGFDMILSFSNISSNRQKGYEKLGLDMITAIQNQKFAIGQKALQYAQDYITILTPVAEPTEIDNSYFQNDPNSRVFYM
jgi:hypothetical protein